MTRYFSVLAISLSMLIAAAVALQPGSALAQSAPNPPPCGTCPVFDPSGLPPIYGITAHLNPVTTDGDLLWWYDGAPSKIKYAPVLIDIYYTGACGGLGQPACDYHFISDENGLISTRNPTKPSSFNCVIDFYDVFNWDFLGGGCGDIGVPAPCHDPDYQSGVMTSHFTDTDLNLDWLARLGGDCADGCAYFDRIVVTSDNPQVGSHGLRPTDPLPTCPVFSDYVWAGPTSVTVNRADFEDPLSGFAADLTPCDGSKDICLPYRFQR